MIIGDTQQQNAFRKRYSARHIAQNYYTGALIEKFQYASYLQTSELIARKLATANRSLLSIRVTKNSGHGRGLGPLCKTVLTSGWIGFITMQNLIDLSHTACTHVGGPKVRGTLRLRPLRWGRGWPVEICPSPHLLPLTTPNVVVLGQTVRTQLRRSAVKIRPSAPRFSRSLRSWEIWNWHWSIGCVIQRWVIN